MCNDGAICDSLVVQEVTSAGIMYQLVPSGDALWVCEQHGFPVGHTEPPAGWNRLRGRRLVQVECVVTAKQTVAEGGCSAKRLAVVWVDSVIGNVHTSSGGDNINYRASLVGGNEGATQPRGRGGGRCQGAAQRHCFACGSGPAR